MKQFLNQFDHSNDSKTKFSKLNNLSDQVIRSLYSSYKNSNNLGSILKITGEDLEKMDIDMITYSFPCQDLSSAGKNKGMSFGSNTRSGLL